MCLFVIIIPTFIICAQVCSAEDTSLRSADGKFIKVADQSFKKSSTLRILLELTLQIEGRYQEDRFALYYSLHNKPLHCKIDITIAIISRWQSRRLPGLSSLLCMQRGLTGS